VLPAWKAAKTGKPPFDDYKGQQHNLSIVLIEHENDERRFADYRAYSVDPRLIPFERLVACVNGYRGKVPPTLPETLVDMLENLHARNNAGRKLHDGRRFHNKTNQKSI
jgi:hypothetical protein